MKAGFSKMRIEHGTGIMNYLLGECLKIIELSKDLYFKDNKNIEILKERIKKFLYDYNKLYINGENKKNPNLTDYKIYYTESSNGILFFIYNGSIFTDIYYFIKHPYPYERNYNCFKKYGIQVKDLKKAMEEIQKTKSSKEEDKNELEKEINSFSSGIVPLKDIDVKSLKKKIDLKKITSLKLYDMYHKSDKER